MGLLRPSLDIALRRWHLTGACDGIYVALEMQILSSLSSRTLPPSSVPIEPSISPQNAFHNLSADSQACDYCKSRASPTIWRRG